MGERGRRRSGHGRGAGRDRALLLRRRRWWLLRLLRRRDRRGVHDRRPGDRATARWAPTPSSTTTAPRCRSRRRCRADSPWARPGTPMTWARALEEFGTMSLSEVLQGGIRLAERGFVVDETFRQQTADNEAKFSRFRPTADLFLPGGQPPEVGTVLRNPDLADTYRAAGRQGRRPVLHGGARRRHRRDRPGPARGGRGGQVRPGLLKAVDLARLRRSARAQPTRVDYRGLEVYGMAPPSSGGSTVGEALNVLEQFPVSDLPDVGALHHLPGGQRAGRVRRPQSLRRRPGLHPGARWTTCCPTSSRRSGPAPSRPTGRRQAGAGRRPGRRVRPVPRAGQRRPGAGGAEGPSTTHLTVGDAEGNIASYTLTIEQTGGSGITVPGRGFILNNELTDFTFAARRPDGAGAEPAGAGQAPAQQHGADDRARRRRTGARPRLPGRQHDHHDRAPDAGEPHRPEPGPRRRDRRSPRQPAQHRDGRRRACLPRAVRRSTRVARTRFAVRRRSVPPPASSSCPAVCCWRPRSRRGAAVGAPVSSTPFRQAPRTLIWPLPSGTTVDPHRPGRPAADGASNVEQVRSLGRLTTGRATDRQPTVTTCPHGSMFSRSGRCAPISPGVAVPGFAAVLPHAGQQAPLGPPDSVGDS